MNAKVITNTEDFINAAKNNFKGRYTLESDLNLDQLIYDIEVLGELDGNGFKITIPRTKVPKYIGSVFKSNSGRIANLTIQQDYVFEPSSEVEYGVGGFIKINHGTIENCKLDISAISYDKTDEEECNLGGFSIYNEGIIKDCSLVVKDFISAPKNVYGFVYKNTGSILNCLLESKLVSSNNCSGFFFENSGTIENCNINIEFESIFDENEDFRVFCLLGLYNSGKVKNCNIESTVKTECKFYVPFYKNYGEISDCTFDILPFFLDKCVITELRIFETCKFNSENELLELLEKKHLNNLNKITEILDEELVISRAIRKLKLKTEKKLLDAD